LISTLAADQSAPPEEIVRQSVALANIDRHQLVSVAGPGSLAAMVSLCRDGFEHVECARQATCSCADQASDVLLVVGLMPADELAAVLRRTCRLLRDGGVLVVQRPRSNEDTVRVVLQAMGLAIGATTFDLAAGRLAAHTVHRIVALRQAS
jgi:hypothetical protein